MEFIFGIFVFIFGLIIGSFLNVVIYRYNTGATIGGRSMCLSCGSQLTWRELLPLVSFLVLRGRCKVCKSAISWQYPLVEFTVALLFLIAYLVFGLTFYTAYVLVQIAILMVIFVYDMRHKIIPDGFVYAFTAFSFLYILYQITLTGFESQISMLIAGPIFFTPFALLWFVSHGTWMGFGDAKLALGIGWFLGLSGGYIAIALSFWIGAIIGLGMIGLSKTRTFFFAKKHVTMKSEIPFGPFLILGTLIELFFATSFESFITLFF